MLVLCVSLAVLSVVLGAWSVRFFGWADRVDCRCFLSSVFLGVARRLELSPCNTDPAGFPVLSANAAQCAAHAVRAALQHRYHLQVGGGGREEGLALQAKRPD